MKTRPTKVTINLENLRHNVAVIRDKIGDTKLMAVIKADAYGHGIVEYAKTLSDVGVEYFGVAIIEEAILIREAGMTTPILVLGDVMKDQIDLFFKYDVAFTVASDSKMLAINSAAKRLNKKAIAHLKIDTGMGRIGVNWQRVWKYKDAMRNCDHIEWEGVFTHLAQAEGNEEYSYMQFNRFKIAIKELEENTNIKFNIKHISNSAGVCLYEDMNMDMVRVGIMLHGAYPTSDFASKLNTKSVMSFTTNIIYFKVVDGGEFISYGSRWTPKDNNTRVVTLPVGYADGYGRNFKYIPKVLINGKKYPVVGIVCMDQCMVSLGVSGEAYPGDEVVLIGRQGNENITAEELAEHIGTNPYDVFVKISKRVPRIYINK